MKNKVYLIAEIGVNHNGSIQKAKKLIKNLAVLDIDAIKIQAFSAKNIASKNAELAGYQKRNISKINNQYEMLKKYEFSKSEIKSLYDFSKVQGIELISSIFSLEDFIKLNNMPKNKIKIPSGEFTNFELIDYALNNYKNIILSTGLSDFNEIKKTMNKIKKQRKDFKGVSLLHSTSAYPCPDEQADMKSIITLKNKYNIKVGYSDHTVGSVAAIMAVSMGAEIIEKHVTLDKNLPGPDHKASANIPEFREFVKNVRTAEKMLGDGKKAVQVDAKANKKAVKKSIYTKRKINKGERFSKEDLAFLRPAGGLLPEDIGILVGKKAKKNYKSGEIISKKELKK